MNVFKYKSLYYFQLKYRHNQFFYNQFSSLITKRRHMVISTVFPKREKKNPLQEPNEIESVKLQLKKKTPQFHNYITINPIIYSI